MNKKRDLSGVILAFVTGAAFLAAMLLRAFFPRIILPRVDGITLVTISLMTLIIEHYLVKGHNRDFRLVPLYAFLVFGIFPWVSCFFVPAEAAKIAVFGAIVFTVVTYLFDMVIDRLSTGPVAKVAPFVSAFGLYLAAQCLMGIV